jgi:hypothetical protein
MQINIKLIAAIVLIAGAWSAFVLSGLVFDKSYMTTQNALGEPGATTELWAKFIVSVVITLAGIAVLILSSKRIRQA